MDAAPLETFTILTTDPNELMEPVHNRMPVILERKDYGRWLDPGDPARPPVDLLRPYPAERMQGLARQRARRQRAQQRPGAAAAAGLSILNLGACLTALRSCRVRAGKADAICLWKADRILYGKTAAQTVDAVHHQVLTLKAGDSMNTGNGKTNGDANLLHLTGRFASAVDYARTLHIERRKGTGIPFMAHLLGVAALVMGEAGHVAFPISEDMVIAALLHDAVEDHGGLARLTDIERNFGSSVARMVEGLSDSLAEDSSRKESWLERKKAYIGRLPREQADTRLISAADKLYNARAILEDYREFGPEVWKRLQTRARRSDLVLRRAAGGLQGAGPEPDCG